MIRSFRPVLLAGSAALLCLAATAGPVRADTAADHAAAQAALGDVRAAMAVITTVEDSYETDPASYRAAAQKAVNVLVGTRDPSYAAAAGTPDDEAGAIGRIDALLDRNDTPPWADPLRAAEVNARAAVARLQTAAKSRELSGFQIAASEALNDLLVAEGRPTDADVFGGLLGALGTTELGVPLGAHTVDACAAGSQAGWAVHGGRLAFVAVAPGSEMPSLDTSLGVTAVTAQDGLVMLRTAAWPIVQRDCAAKPGGKAALLQPAQAMPAAGTPGPAELASAQPTASSQPVMAEPAASQPAAAASGTAAPAAAGPRATAPGQGASAAAASGQADAAPVGNAAPFPTLYTASQAVAGKAVYAENCVSCHGADMHGVAAPAIAGTDFLASAADNSWSLEAIRTIVFTMMPLNAGGTLSPEQYADVTAYILASNCLPSGSTPFPQDDSPALDQVQLHPLPHPQPNQNALGVCPVG